VEARRDFPSAEKIPRALFPFSVIQISPFDDIATSEGKKGKSALAEVSMQLAIPINMILFSE